MNTKLANNWNIASLAEELEAIAAKTAELKKQETAVKRAVMDYYSASMADGYKAKGEPFGAVNVPDGDYNVAFNTPKKVKWDQEALASLYTEIGDTAHEYIDIEYSVSENKYKAWPQAVKDSFIGARTVEPGSVTVKIEKLEGK